MKQSINLYQLAKHKVQSLQSKLRQDSSSDFCKNEHGLQTLLNIQSFSNISSIEVHQKSAQSIPITQKKCAKTISEEVQEMRKKRQLIQGKQLRLTHSEAYHCYSCQIQDKNSYKAFLVQEIRKQKMKKFFKIIKSVCFKKLSKQLTIYTSVTHSNTQYHHKLLQVAFSHWKMYTSELSDRKIMMQYIKDKIIQKRKTKQQNH